MDMLSMPLKDEKLGMAPVKKREREMISVDYQTTSYMFLPKQIKMSKSGCQPFHQSEIKS